MIHLDVESGESTGALTSTWNAFSQQSRPSLVLNMFTREPHMLAIIHGSSQLRLGKSPCLLSMN